ncbi:histidine phosphatase family protein [Thiomicrorhabdus indica]|uniref:histidine phosphatase family protein n=1 Tax=Thiomicrorhabdus indica TaxID=2267253 RepID=UPI002AA6A648|nr:histidine phosphatase family protein [Thiomicrorhabdus indica]
MKQLIFILALSVLGLSHSANADNATFWQSLQQGGKVVLLRHASIDREFGSPFVLDDSCFSERNLNDLGVQQAKQIGQLFKKHKIGIDAVYSSEHCRTKDTAENAFSVYQVSKALRLIKALPADEANKRLQETREWIGNFKSTKNLILVTHRPNILSLTNLNIEPAEMVLLDPLGDGLFEVIDQFKHSSQ